MKPVIKVDLNKVASGGNPVIVDVGCGRNKRPGSIGIDRVDLPGVDIVADIEEGLEFLPDGFADEIYTCHCLEHLQNFESVMCEIVRVLKKEGKAIVTRNGMGTAEMERIGELADEVLKEAQAVSDSEYSINEKIAARIKNEAMTLAGKFPVR